MAELKNPALAGDFLFDTVVYASAGSNYGTVPALVQYKVYDTPDPAYVTPRINMSPFANLGSAPWTFPNTSMPLNGHICIPRGRGPFSLMMFAAPRQKKEPASGNRQVQVGEADSSWLLRIRCVS